MTPLPNLRCPLCGAANECAAAGTPNAVFPHAPQDLVNATGARVLAVRGTG